MNILAIDYNPKLCAQSLCDLHVSRFCLEGTQILASLFQLHLSIRSVYRPMKSWERRNPMMWLASSEANQLWYLRHMQCLFEEYTWRFGRVHASQPVFEAMFADWRRVKHHMVFEPLTEGTGAWDKRVTRNKTPFVLELQKEVPVQRASRWYQLATTDPVLAYRRYYAWKAEQWEQKGRPMRYRREPPVWLTDLVEPGTLVEIP